MQTPPTAMQVSPSNPIANWSPSGPDLAAARAARVGPQAPPAVQVPEPVQPPSPTQNTGLIQEPPKEAVSAMLLQLLQSLWEASGKAVQASVESNLNNVSQTGSGPSRPKT